MSNIDEKVKKLLEYDLQPTLRGGWKITEEMRVLIHEIAEECNSLEVTQKINTDIPEWLEEAAPEEIYIHMLKKIVSAPTRMHMICVPRVLIPIMKQTAELAGFEVVGRIVLKDKHTGKEYR